MQRIWIKPRVAEQSSLRGRHKKISPDYARDRNTTRDSTLLIRDGEQGRTTRKPKVFVAVSGGVDSSVAAALLKKRGFEVIGVFMKPWSPNRQSPIANRKELKPLAISYKPFACLWERDREDALRVAAKLDIALLTWDLSDEYEEKVAKYMIDGYRRGITPNPDVMCNKHIKFGVFLRRALKQGADYIATGHYVRLQRQLSKSKKIFYSLLKAKDKNKDQSYFLYTLTQKELLHCLFPIGEYTKPQVRQLAKKFGLPNWNKKDSQGVCFIGNLNMGQFLKQYLPLQPGYIVRRSDRKVIGAHQGAWYYTVGQRHGLGLNGNGTIYFVANKDLNRNIIYVDTEKPKSTLFRSYAALNNVSWVDKHPKMPLKAEIKTRYRQKEQKAIIISNTKDKREELELDLQFLKPQRALTSGQAAVLYQGDIVLGGGIIK